MTAVNSERMPNVVIVPIGTQAATKTLPGLYFRKRSRIKEVRYIDQLGIAADNTNYLQISLQDVSGTPVYASLDTRAANQGAVTAMVPIALALTTNIGDTVGSQPECDVPAGTTLQVVATKNGTGVPTLATLEIEYYPL